jgi:hypothetical protein
MVVKNGYMNKRIHKTKVNKRYVNPVIKSTCHDCFTADFFQTAVLAFALFIVLVMELLKNRNLLREMEEPRIFFMGLTALLSLGFIGIIDSIPRVNWKFYAIVLPHDFKYHVKRTVIFLTAVFGLLIIAFIFLALSFNVIMLFKYLYCITLLLFIAINTAFTTGSMFIKAVGLVLITIAVLWLSALPVYFLVLPVFPALIIMLKAKNEYKERYFL